MKQLFSQGSFLIILVIMVICVVIAVIVPLLTPKKKEDFPYKKNNYLLTLNEKVFYTLLKEIVDPNKYEIFSQVRLSDVLKIETGTGKYMTYFNKISKKSPDFVLCDKKTTPLLILELDDSSHNKEARIERDGFVDKALAAAKIPILHIICKKNYDKEELKKKIEETLNNQLLLK